MEDIAYILHWNKDAESSLKPLLIQENIPFEEREMLLKGGFFANEGVTLVEILQSVSNLGLAGVFIVWIKAKANRQIKITKTDRTVEYLAHGYSEKEVVKILKESREINAIETPENKP